MVSYAFTLPRSPFLKCTLFFLRMCVSSISNLIPPGKPIQRRKPWIHTCNRIRHLLLARRPREHPLPLQCRRAFATDCRSPVPSHQTRVVKFQCGGRACDFRERRQLLHGIVTSRRKVVDAVEPDAAEGVGKAGGAQHGRSRNELLFLRSQCQVGSGSRSARSQCCHSIGASGGSVVAVVVSVVEVVALVAAFVRLWTDDCVARDGGRICSRWDGCVDKGCVFGYGVLGRQHGVPAVILVLGVDVAECARVSRKPWTIIGGSIAVEMVEVWGGHIEARLDRGHFSCR